MKKVARYFLIPEVPSSSFFVRRVTTRVHKLTQKINVEALLCYVKILLYVRSYMASPIKALLALPAHLTRPGAAQRLFHGSALKNARRGPKRYFGYTRAQILDGAMLTNSNICLLISLSSIPFFIYLTSHYVTKVKPETDKRVDAAKQDLLSEGKPLTA